MEKQENWLRNGEYIDLVKFLVEKTTHVWAAMNIRKLAREFNFKNNFSTKNKCVEGRIHRFRQIIHKVPYLNTETKVKLLFGLNGPVDCGFLLELRKEAEVTVDELNRITHYKKNGGGLELNRKYIHQYSSYEVSSRQSESSNSNATGLTTEGGSMDHDYCLENEVKLEPLEPESEPNPENSDIENKSIEDFIKMLSNYMAQNPSNSSEDVKNDQIPLTLVLESFHDFIDILDLPILSDIQKKIEEGLKKKDQIITINDINLSLKLCLSKVEKSAEIMIESNEIESISLKEFVINFSHFVRSLKLRPSTYELQKTLKGIIRELRVQDKFAPMEAVKNALQSTIDILVT